MRVGRVAVCIVNLHSSPVQGGRAATWGAALAEQMVLERIAGGRSSRGDAKLAIQRGGMVVDGAWTNHQVRGNLGVGPAQCYQAQHLYLAICQSRKSGTCSSNLRTRCVRYPR